MPWAVRPEDFGWLAPAHAALALLAAVALGPRLREASWRLLAGIAALALFCAAWIAAVDVPLRDLLPMREGFSLDHLRMVVGYDNDTGGLVDALWRPLVAPGPSTFRAFVQVNRVTVLGWALLCLLAAARDPRALTVVLVALVGGQGLVRATLHTELNAGAAGLYLALGGLLLWSATDTSQRLWRRLLAGAGVVGIAAVLPGTREELMAFSAGAVVGLVLSPTGLEARWTALFDRVSAWLATRPWVAVLLVAGWVGLSAAAYTPSVAMTDQSSWLWRAAHPLHVLGLTLWAFFPAVMPVGLVLLATRGAWIALRTPLRTGFAPLALWLVYSTARVAAHGGGDVWANASVARWELYRYVLPLYPVVILLALLGAKGLAELQPPGWLVPAFAALAVPWPFLIGLQQTAPVGGPRLPDGMRPLQSADAMIEVRTLIQRAEAEPGCAILTPGWTWGGRPSAATFRWGALQPGPRGLRYVDSKIDGATPPEQVATTLGLGCAVVWRSLDCAQEASPGCAWTDRLAPISTSTLHHQPFEHPVHGGVWPDEVVVGFYALATGP